MTHGLAALHHAARAGAGAKVLDLLLSWIDSASSSKSKGGGKGKSKPKSGGGGGVVINLKDVWGRTALHWAAINGHAREVQFLLDFGADDTATDMAGESALEMAERRARCGAQGNCPPPPPHLLLLLLLVAVVVGILYEVMVTGALFVYSWLVCLK